MARSNSKATAEFLARQEPSFLREGAISAKNNAWVHFEAAEGLSRSGHTGLAISHFVLSIEESIKAHTLITFALKHNDDLELLAGAFSSHRAKHDAALAFSGASALLAPIAVKLAERSSIDSKEKEDAAAVLAGWGQKLDFEVLLASFDLDWWKQANSMKEKGFYVDVDRNSGVWIAPDSIPQSEAVKARDIAHSVLERIELLFAVPFDTLNSIGDARNAPKNV
jgi:AbiV family abortive infection protein